MMEITIYQIDLDKDENRVAFIGHEALEHYQGTSEIDSAIYEKVYEGGDVECGGYSASVRAADGTLWYVHIDMDPEQNAEGPLTIEPVAEE